MKELKNKVDKARYDLEKRKNQYKLEENYLKNEADFEYEINLKNNEYLRNKAIEERNKIREQYKNHEREIEQENIKKKILMSLIDVC